MRKPAEITREVDLEELKRREKGTKDFKEKKRLMGIRLKLEGYPLKKIMEIIPVSQSGLLTWVNDFNKEGYEGLKSRKPKGREKFLSEDQTAIVKGWLDNGPKDTHDCVFWTGAKLIKAIEKEFGVTYSSSGIYELLKDLGYSRQVVKTRHYKCDPEKVEEFKKNFPVWSRR